MGNAEAQIGANGITEKTNGNAGTDDGLVVKSAAHDGYEGWGANQGDAGGEGCVGVETEEGAEQHVKEEGAKGSHRGEEEDGGVNVGEGLEAHLRSYSHAEDEDEVGASLEGTLQAPDSWVERGENGEQADAEDED